MNKKRCTNFSKKIFIFLEHNFLPLIQFLLHFYALIFFRYQIFQFFPSISTILASQNHFFILVNSLFSLSVFPCEEFLVLKFLVLHEELQWVDICICILCTRSDCIACSKMHRYVSLRSKSN